MIECDQVMSGKNTLNLVNLVISLPNISGLSAWHFFIPKIYFTVQIFQLDTDFHEFNLLYVLPQILFYRTNLFYSVSKVLAFSWVHRIGRDQRPPIRRQWARFGSQ